MTMTPLSPPPDSRLNHGPDVEGEGPDPSAHGACAIQIQPQPQAQAQEPSQATSTAHEPPSTAGGATSISTDQAPAPPQPPALLSAASPTAPITVAATAVSPSPDSSAAAAIAVSSYTTTAPTSGSKPSSSSSKMIFSDMYKSPRSPLSKIRRPSLLPTPLAIPTPDYDADMLSRDKVKQKEAVKKHLAEKVRNDWEFNWLPPTSAPGEPVADSETDTSAAPPEPEPAQPVDKHLNDDGDDRPDSDAESVYSTVSEDPLNFRPRLEWVSDLSDDEHLPRQSLSPFRFDSPDSIGSAVKASVTEKRTQRRRALREEMQWNDGLACFEARRNAWTGAKTVHVRPKVSSPTSALSSLSPRRLFHRSPLSASPANPISPLNSHQRQSNDNSAGAASDGSEAIKDAELTTQRTKDSSNSLTTASAPPAVNLPVETLLPLPAPILPPNNPMRASITPAVYISLYEKVIVHNLTPSCPVNLSDMIRSCVAGWKRDGEWPPKPSTVDPASVAVRKKKRLSIGGGDGQTGSRRLSFGFLGRGDKNTIETEESSPTSKGIRRSIQRVLGLGHSSLSPTAATAPATANGTGTGTANVNPGA